MLGIIITSIVFMQILTRTNAITCNAINNNCQSPIQYSNIKCTAEGCEGKVIECPDGSECNINCSGTQGCRDSIIHCPANAACNIQCTGSYGGSCQGAEIITYDSTEDNPLTVDCLATSSCLWTIFNAAKASSLTIDGCTSYLSCNRITIYCPPSTINGPQCTIEGTYHIQKHIVST